MNDVERRKIFSQNLTDILDVRGKSQIEVANAIGVSQQTFNTWCRGVALPRMGKIQLLADYFNIDMGDLIEPGRVPEYDPDMLTLIDLYSRCDEKGKSAIMSLARTLAD